MSDDFFSDLLAGPNATKIVTNRKKQKIHIRSGTRSERNKIEKMMTNESLVMDAIALTLWLRLANPDGSKKFEDQPFKEFAEELDYDAATEVAVLIRKLDGAEEDDGLTLDEKVAKAAKNSKRQKGAT